MDFREKSWNHRMVWVGRNLKDHVFPTLCSGQGTSHQSVLLRAPSNLALSTDSKWGIHNFSGQPVPHHLDSEEFLPNIQCKLALSLISLCPVTPCSSSLVSPAPSLFQVKLPQLSQPVSTGQVLQPSDHLHDLLWNHFHGLLPAAAPRPPYVEASREWVLAARLNENRNHFWR